MLYDLANYPEWLVGAFVIGAVVGWCTYSDAPSRGWTAKWVRIVSWVMWAALFTIGLVIALEKLVHGRYGLWLEIGLLLTGFYILGCFVGGWLKGVHKRAAAAAPVMPDVDAQPAVPAWPKRPAAEAAATASVALDRPVAEAAAKAEAGPPAAAAAAEKAEAIDAAKEEKPSGNTTFNWPNCIAAASGSPRSKCANPRATTQGRSSDVSRKP